MTDSDDVRIEVNTRYLQEHSDPAASRYAFAYTVEISNTGSDTIKLLNRHWLITDDNDKVEEVRGEGVIGQQPEIHPGQSFHYTSGAVIETKFGTMCGDYELLTADGTKIKAAIPPFLLAMPLAVH